MIRCITRNFISLPAISDFRRGKQRPATSGCAYVGTNGTRKRRASQRCGERKLFFTRQPLAGIPRKRKTLVKRNTPHGKRSSGVTPSRMAATLLLRIAWAMKRPLAARELNFGAKALFAGQTGKSLQKVPSIRKKL